jgi:hypothetical protein
VKISITEQHIAAGITGTVGSCPVELAVKEVVGEDVPVTVSCRGIRINGEYFLLPRRIFDFIYRYDRGDAVVPVDCELKLELWHPGMPDNVLEGGEAVNLDEHPPFAPPADPSPRGY